jgi:hypothetical protein
MRLGGLQSRSGGCGKDKNFDPDENQTLVLQLVY